MLKKNKVKIPQAVPGACGAVLELNDDPGNLHS
jgi:hypothetical protein